LLYLVESHTPACHTGNRTCFHNLLEKQKNWRYLWIFYIF
jgi:glycerol uptake facilitator-like aquaporin